MIDWIPTDADLMAFVKDRIVILALIYGVFCAMFPESKILRAIGEAFSKIRIPKIGGRK